MANLIGNLIDNAFKYGNGEVRISGALSKPGNLSICVEDNGPGIAEDKQKILLQRGERSDTTLPGQGIGLAVVTDIVSSYRGSIEIAQSSLGGVAITLRF